MITFTENADVIGAESLKNFLRGLKPLVNTSAVYHMNFTHNDAEIISILAELFEGKSIGHLSIDDCVSEQHLLVVIFLISNKINNVITFSAFSLET